MYEQDHDDVVLADRYTDTNDDEISGWVHAVTAALSIGIVYGLFNPIVLPIVLVAVGMSVVVYCIVA